MDYIDIEFNNTLGSNLEIFAMKYPAIPAAVEKTDLIAVPGTSGNLHIRKKCFEESEIPVEFNYIGKEEMWNERWRETKAWLSAINAELCFGDDPNFFYRISKVVIGSNERVTKRIGKFVASFVTKDGLQYFKNGKQAIDYTEIVRNPGIFSQPIYVITGEGVCTLTVNGKSVNANIGQNLTIDTERMISYREDGVLQNTAIKGNYEDLYLQEGDNKITVTDGFECKVIPRWRCL